MIMPLYTNKKTLRALWLMLIMLCIAALGHAQSGSLDASFGTGGKTITDFGSNKDFATCMALQSDNKIVVGGYTTLASKQYFAIARYNTNGLPDSTFGTNGKVTTGFDGITEAYLESIKMQKDGKIVAGGYIVDGANDNFVLTRYKTNGSLDSTFGTNGITVTQLTATKNKLTSIAIDSVSGAIIVTGYINCKPAVRRYESNGGASLFFAQLGVNAPGLGDECYNSDAMFLFATGETLIGGQETGTVDNMFLMKLKNDGQGELDSAFGTDGFTFTHIGDSTVIYGLTAYPGGRILVVGATYSQQGGAMAGQLLVARYNSDGTPDLSFGTNGYVLFSIGDNAVGYAVAVEANGEIMVTATVTAASTDKIDVLLLNPDGTIDSTFGNNGQAMAPDGQGDDAVASAIQPDGRLVVAGYTLSADSTGYNFIVARYNTDESLPIKLASFTASPVKSAVLLNWSTATETNSSYFAIQRSNRPNSFATIGKLNSAGNSTQLQQYSYLDAQPLKGDNYYRLKQVDKDGKFSYSKTIHLVFGDEPYLVAYPNPAKNSIKVGGLITAATISVVDASGKVIRRYAVTGGDYSINVQNLSAGLYFIRIQQGSKVNTLKLVKQ